jgi:hypothetical protein
MSLNFKSLELLAPVSQCSLSHCESAHRADRQTYCREKNACKARVCVRGRVRAKVEG